MARCLRFIVTGDNNDEEAINFLKQAAKEAIDAEIDVDWFSFEDIERDSDKIGNEAVIVCETFEGNAFESLKSQKQRIVGPACIVHCLRNVEPLPSVAHPVLSLAMSDVVACCTNISIEQRSKLNDLIVAMGGIMIGDFTQSVTHLIAGEVGSKKYKVACGIGIPIMQQSWVSDCWSQSRYKVIAALDKTVQKNLCPCFKGLTICVTGLDASIRHEVKKLTEKNGGKYSGELNMRTCTHLIVKFAKGEKYNYARQWKIHCVSSEWFYDCVKEGHWVDESSYEITPGESSRMDDSKILDIGRSRVNMTIQSDLDCSVVSTKAAKMAEKSMKSRETAKSIEDRADVNDNDVKKKSTIRIRTFDTCNLKLTDIKMKSNMLLDGCKIYLSEMPQDLTDQFRKLINTAGAMRFNSLNSNVTHIIVGDVVSNSIQEYLEENLQKPHIVSPDWLIDSCKMGQVMKEEAYSLLEEDRSDEIMAKPSMIPPKREMKNLGNIEKKKDPRHAPSFHLDDDFEDDVFFGQYLPQAESSRISFVAENKVPVLEERKEKQRISDELHSPDSAEAIAGPKDELEQSTCNKTVTGKTFQQCKFVVKFFEEETAEQVKSLVQEFKAKIVNQEARADYVIVPLAYEKKRRIGKKEVTICWLEQSLEAENLLDKNSCFIFRPFHLPPDCLPLKDFVMTVSQFSGIQREHIIQLADLLGALMQDNFVRKATNDLLANTHLMLAEASGAKYEAACKWGVTCVSKEWLFACAEQKKLMPVEDFPLKKEEMEEDGEEEDDEEQEEEQKNKIGMKTEDAEELRGNISRDDAIDYSAKEVEDNEDEDKAGYGTEDESRIGPNHGLTVAESSSNRRPALGNATKDLHEQEDDPPPNFEDVNPASKPLLTPANKARPLLQRGKPFRPSFDLNDMMEYLKSPASCFTPRTKSRASRGSFAFDEFVGNQLRKALEITGGNGSKRAGTSDVIEQGAKKNRDPVGKSARDKANQQAGSSNREAGTSGVDNKSETSGVSKESGTSDVNDIDNAAGKDVAVNKENNETKIEEDDENKKENVMNGILKGVVIAVSKRLSNRQTELHNLASLLGADYRYVYDESCTHLIHKGKVTDNLTEVKQARSQEKLIVSEHWLEACLESNSKVQEDFYPSTFNPKMSLSVVSKGKKSTRASKSRSTRQSQADVTADTTETQDNKSKKSLSRKRNSSTKEEGKISEDDSSRRQSIKPGNKDGETSKGGTSRSIVSPPAFENTSSLDARLEFKRQIEEIMEATKGNKGGMLRNRRQLLNSDSPNDDSSLKRSSVARRLRTRQSSQRSNSESSRSSSEKKQSSKVSCFPTLQPSQGDVITYDDPAGRLERERILAQLKAASPSQDGFTEFRSTELSDFPVEEMEEEDPAEDVPPVHENNQGNAKTPTKANNRQEFPRDFDHLSTPPHRPINMHISNPVQPPAPVNLLEDDDTEENVEAEHAVYKFILSAMTPQEKIHYSAMIEELGGTICDSQYFTLECTHVIVGAPNRNEKFLASVAAGKWVLHKSYLEASREAGVFVSEESHEWGTEAEPTKLTIAVRRWRQKLSEDRKLDASAGAFKSWHVLLCVGSSVKQHGFKRMLEAGSGTVACTHPPFNNFENVTHAFIDSNKAKPGLIDYNQLYSAGIWVLRPDYIVDYLTTDPPPPTLKYVIPEIQKLMESEAKLNNTSDSKKRKNAEETSSQKMKRTRK